MREKGRISVCLRKRIRERENERADKEKEREIERQIEMNEKKCDKNPHFATAKKGKKKKKKYINFDTKYALVCCVDLERFEFFARINLRQFRSESRHQQRLELMSSMRKNRRENVQMREK